jgi:hypothetical protein
MASFALMPLMTALEVAAVTSSRSKENPMAVKNSLALPKCSRPRTGRSLRDRSQAWQTPTRQVDRIGTQILGEAFARCKELAELPLRELSDAAIVTRSCGDIRNKCVHLAKPGRIARVEVVGSHDQDIDVALKVAFPASK